MGVFDYNLGNDWKINSKVKVSDYVNDFGLYVAASGKVNAPASLSDYLAKYGYVGSSRGLSEAQSVAYIEKATNATAIKTPIGAPGASVGNYAVYATGQSGGHVLYGQVLPSRKFYFYDPQIGSRALNLEQARAQYNLTRTYYLEPK